MTRPSPHARRPIPLVAVPLAALALPALLLFAPAATAQSAASPAPSVFLGEWELDLARMPANYGPPPKRVTFRFQAIDDGQWRTTIDIVAPDDSVRHSAIQYRFDGRAVDTEGDRIEGDHAAVNSPAPNVLVLGMAKDKQPGSVRIYAVSADGREMTESAANIDDTGVPFVRNFHFKRVR